MSQTEIDFEKLFGRPRNYHSLPEDEQWAIDKELGLLDIWLDEDQLTDEMRYRYTGYFGLAKGDAA